MLKSLKKSAFLRYALYAFVFIAAAISAAAILATVFINSEKGRIFITDTVNSALSGKMEIGKITFHLIEGSIKLENINLEGPEKIPVAGISGIRAEIDWMRLLAGEISLAEVKISSPKVYVFETVSGQLNIFSLLKPSEKQESPSPQEGAMLPLNLIIRKAVISDAVFVYADRNIKTSVAGLSAEADYNLALNSGSLRIGIPAADLDVPGFKTGFEAAELGASLEKGNIEKLCLKTATRFGILELKGRIRDVFYDPYFELNLNTLAALDGIRAACGLDFIMNGMASGNLKVSGTIGDPEASLQVMCSSGRFVNTPVSLAEITSYIKNRQAVINIRASEKGGNLRADSYVNLASAFPYSFFPENSESVDIEKMSYGIDLKIRNMDLTDITGSETLSSGSVSGSIVSEFKGVTPSEMLANIKTDITGKNLAWKTSDNSYAKPYKESPELKLKADIKTDRGIIDVRNFLLEAAGSKITSKTRLEAHSGLFSGSLKIDSPDISRLSDLSGIIKASGSVMAEAEYSGTIEKPSFKAKVNADRLKIDDVTIGSLIIDAGLSDSGVLKISRLELKNRSSSASASGNAVIPFPVNAKENTEPAADPDKKGHQDQVISEKISDMPVDLKVSIKNFNPSFFVESPLPFAGIFDAELKAGGKTSAPVAELHAQGRNISVSGNVIGNAALDAGLSKGRLNIRNLDIQNRSSLLIIAGEAGLFKGKGFEISPDPEIKAEIKKADINIGDFFPGSEGNITASGNIAGSVNDPSGSIDVKTGKLTFDKIVILSAGLRTSIKNRIISIDNLDIRPAENERIMAAGWIGTDGKFSFNLDSDEISVSAFRKALPLSDLSGKISLSATGSGTFSSPEIKGAIWFSGLGAKNQTFRDFSLGFGLSGKNFRAESAPDPEFMNIYADLGRKNFSADMNFRELDLAPFFKSAGIDELEGKTGAEISAKGSYAESDRRLSARADIRNLELDYRKKRLLSCSSFSAAFEKDVLSVIKSDIRIMKKGSLSIAGKLDLKNGHDFSIKSSIALDDAAPLVPDMLPDIEGMITADARITGNTSKPVIHGNIGIKNVALTVPETFQRLHDLSGRIVMDQGKITIGTIKGMLDEGTVSLGGNIILDGSHADDIKLRMMVRNLPVRVPDTAEIVMNAGISLTGSQDSSLLSGEAVFVEGVYYKNADLSLVSLPKRPVRKKPPFWESIENPFLKNMGLDISLTKREPLVVDNNLAKLELSPDLRLTGKAASPVVSGRCKVDSGTIYYRKNEYEIKKGVIDFINPYSIEPEFDIESSAKIRKWTVTLKISGTPEKLEFDLSSNPALDDNDILSLVILGNVTKNVSASQAAKRPAAEMLGEMLASTFSDEIKSVSGLDILEAGDNQSEEEDLTRVTIGKNLSKRLAVKYSVDSRAGEISQKAIAEYKLLENILLNGFRDSNGIYGGELQYRLEFR